MMYLTLLYRAINVEEFSLLSLTQLNLLAQLQVVSDQLLVPLLQHSSETVHPPDISRG